MGNLNIEYVSQAQPLPNVLGLSLPLVYRKIQSLIKSKQTICKIIRKNQRHVLSVQSPRNMLADGLASQLFKQKNISDA